MCESFIVTCPDSTKLKIDEFHINLWHFSPSHTYVDIGLLLEIDLSLMTKENLTIEFYSPFKYVPGKTQNLSSLLSKNEMLQLIFNDEIKCTNNCIVITKKSNVIEFKNKKKMILTESSFYEADGEQKINIIIDNKNFNMEIIRALSRITQ